MSVVVGLIDGADVYMASDSAVAPLDRSWIREDATPKVWRSGTALIGVVGSCRVQDLVAAPLQVDAHDDPAKYVRWDVVQQIRAALQIGGALKTERGVESMDAEFLIGIGGRLFHIVQNFGVVEPRAYHAIGAGAQYALGALQAMKDSGWLPSTRVSLAVEAAAAFSPYVMGRVSGMRLKGKEAA